eukprot:3779222-Alexandrium_andersonii.AAC.1
MAPLLSPRLRRAPALCAGIRESVPSSPCGRRRRRCAALSQRPHSVPAWRLRAYACQAPCTWWPGGA